MPNQCVQAFASAFSDRAGFANADWDIKARGTGVVAIYKGRRGLGTMAGIMSKTSALEQDTAIGSEVSFEIQRSEGGRTVCAM